MGVVTTTDQRLLNALAEELKVPLLRIARQSELAGSDASFHTAEMAITLIDGYILGLQQSEQTSLELEPVTASSILFETAQVLSPIAKQQGYELQIDVEGKFGPVMGDRRALQTAFTVLGYELMSTPADEVPAVLTLATHRSRLGIAVGMFTNNPLLGTDSLRRARALMGTARQTLPSISASNGAGVLIADTLLNNLSCSLKVMRHRKQSGLGITLLPSQQMQLV